MIYRTFTASRSLLYARRSSTEMSDTWVAQQGATTAFSFIGFVLVNVPLYWHIRGTFI